MNFLAHLYLGGNNDQLVVGNFIADHVKGKLIDSFDEEVRRGIRMHRDIDHFTDNHPIVKQSINRLRPVYRKYSGVIVDMYYDHFLAVDWLEYSNEDLESFTIRTYNILENNNDILPARSQRVLAYMKMQNWLLSYAELHGLQQAFTGMSRRTTFVSNMEHAIQDLQANYNLFKNEFRLYFPELRQFVKQNY